MSVCVPAYNCQETIERCMRSVAEQTRACEVELIVVNDASPDNTSPRAREVAQDITSSLAAVRVIDLPCNHGPGFARKTAVEQAQGTYIGFLDADDRIDAQFIERLLPTADNVMPDIVMGQQVAEGGPRDGEPMDKAVPGEPYDLLIALLKGTVHGWMHGKLYRRELLISHIDAFAPEINICEDLYANIHLIAHARLIRRNQGARYYYNLASSTSSSARLNENGITSAIKADEHITELVRSFADDNTVVLTQEQSHSLYEDYLPYRYATTKMWLLAASDTWRPELVGLYSDHNLSQLKDLPLASRVFLRACDLGLKPIVRAGVAAANKLFTRNRGRIALG